MAGIIITILLGGVLVTAGVDIIISAIKKK